MYLSDKMPTLKMLDFAFYFGSTPTFYTLICTEHCQCRALMQHTMFIVK